MPDIKFYCLSCGKKLGIDAAASGMMIECPGCGTQVRVPEQSKPPPPPEPAAPRTIMPARPVKATPVQAPAPPVASPPAAADFDKMKAERDAIAAECNHLKAQGEVLSQEKSAWLAERDAMESRLASLEKDVGEARAAAAKAQADAQVAEQSRMQAEDRIAELKQKISLPVAERDRLIRDTKSAQDALAAIKTENEKLAAAKSHLSEELSALRKEHNEQLARYQEAQRLTASIDEMKKQMAELREQEKLLVSSLSRQEAASGRVVAAPPVTQEPSAAPRAAKPVPRRAPGAPAAQWIAAAMGVLLILMSGMLVVLWFWPDIGRRSAVGPSELVSRVEQVAIITRNELTLGRSMEMDGIELQALGVRVAPVEMVSLSGLVSTTAQHYLIVDVRITNRSNDQDVYVFRTWRDAKLTDENSRAYPQAFTDSIGLGEVLGVANGVDLTTGLEVEDRVIFEWEDRGATGFVVTADPVFWRRSGEENFVPIVRRSVTITFSRNEIGGL